MCIKKRRKNFQSRQSDRVASLKSARGDGTATESSRDPVIIGDNAKTAEIKVRTCSQQQKASSLTTSQATNNNNNKNSKNDLSASCSPKVSKENIFDDSDYITNINGGGGGRTAETETGNPLQIGTPSTFEKKVEKAEKKQIEKKQHQKREHQHEQRQQQQHQKSSCTSTPEEIKLDKTQDVPPDSLAPVTAQAPTKAYHQGHLKPYQQEQNERTKQQDRKKQQYGTAAPAPTTAAPPTDATTTPLLTEHVTKKVEKENYEELSRIPIFQTANIKREKFPYSNHDQDTMAGISSNFSKTLDVPDENIPNAAEQQDNNSKEKNSNKRGSLKKRSKKSKKKNTKEDDTTQESSKTPMRQH